MEEYFLNQPRHEHNCQKLQNRNENNYLTKDNFLSEFFSEKDKAEARYNLGITPLLNELLAFVLSRTTSNVGNLRFGYKPTSGEEDTNAYSEVLSSNTIYQTLLNYYTKEELDEWRERIADQLSSFKLELTIPIDDDLDKDSINPVLNKVIFLKILALLDGYSRLSKNKLDKEELINYYNIDEVDLIKNALEDSISTLSTDLSDLGNTASDIDSRVTTVKSELKDYIDLIALDITTGDFNIMSEGEVEDILDAIDEEEEENNNEPSNAEPSNNNG